MSKETLQLIKELQESHNTLYKTLFEHYAALRRLLEHALISIDSSMRLLVDAAEANQHVPKASEESDRALGEPEA